MVKLPSKRLQVGEHEVLKFEEYLLKEGERLDAPDNRPGQLMSNHDERYYHFINCSISYWKPHEARKGNKKNSCFEICASTQENLDAAITELNKTFKSIEDLH